MKIIKLCCALIIISSCTKVQPVPQVIDMGIKSTSTAIKSLSLTGSVVTAEFETTIGSKYSVQIIPFGKDEAVKKDGFTATSMSTIKTYDLSGLAKRDYDFVFIDIAGKEIKYPLIIK